MGEGRGGEFRGTARLVASEGAVKGPRFHVNVRAYYYEFRNNGTRAWKLRSACYSFSLFLSVSLPRMEKLNKPRLPRNDQSGGKKELGLGFFAVPRIFFTWTPIRRKVKIARCLLALCED